jgi:hypothetical protein
VEVSSPHVTVDHSIFANFLKRLRSSRTAPLTFALYGDLVRAIDQGEFASAHELVSTLVSQPECPPNLQIMDLADPAFDARAQIYERYIDNDPLMPLKLAPPLPEAAREAKEAIIKTLTLLDSADPELAAEMRELLREIVLCGDRHDAGRVTFEGASAFLLWGAILLNTHRDNDCVAMAQTLAHESAHNLLFGLCPDEPLLLNDPEERFGSPLRPDLRPLEGIYHATYVIARMHRSLRHLAGSGHLSPEDEKRARQEMVQTQRLFKDGLRTLETHAQLTEIGGQILEGAKEYMSTAARSA